MIIRSLKRIRQFNNLLTFHLRCFSNLLIENIKFQHKLNKHVFYTNVINKSKFQALTYVSNDLIIRSELEI